MGSASGTAIRVVIVDDHAVFAEALADALNHQVDIDVLGVAGTLADGVGLVHELEPDVVLMDVRLPDGDGTDGVAEIRSRLPATSVVMLTATTDLDTLSRAVEAGAAGFLSKNEQLRSVAEALRRVSQGAVLFDATTLASVSAHLRHKSRAPGADLTSREREVLQLLADGAPTDAIAEELVLSLHTVRNHIRNILMKLDAHSKLQAVAIAVRHQLVDLNHERSAR